MSTPTPALSWPDPGEVLPIAALRPVLERLSSLAVTRPDVVALIPGLSTGEEEVAADPPPALAQIVDEIGGVRVGDRDELTLLIEDRVGEGPYTLLQDATAFYPLHEGEDVAVVLTLGEDGTPGAVYGIGEDLALHLAAPDLGAYLSRLADALERALAEAEEEAERRGESTVEAVRELLDLHLYRDVLGLDPEDDTVPEATVLEPVPTGEAPEPPAGETLPADTVAVVDLRGAPLGAVAPVMDAELPGDPLDWHLEWRAGGLLLCIVAA